MGNCITTLFNAGKKKVDTDGDGNISAAEAQAAADAVIEAGKVVAGAVDGAGIVDIPGVGDDKAKADGGKKKKKPGKH